MTDTPKKPKGFAYMKLHDPERMSQVAAKGGASVPHEKRSFSTNNELARSAGAKGGMTSKRAKAEP